MGFEPRGIKFLQTKLKTLDLRCAITGSIAASMLAPVAPPRLATIYVVDLEEATNALNLRLSESVSNVMLIEPNDEFILKCPTLVDGLPLATTSQIAADLLTSPGRGPAEAEHLMDWMKENENAWRR